VFHSSSFTSINLLNIPSQNSSRTQPFLAITMPKITHGHTHTFSDGKKVTKYCEMTFSTNDNPKLNREKESTFTHPDTEETFTFRFVMNKNSKDNEHTFTDDTDNGYDSEGVQRYKSY
jgi:hypothetical protein